MSSPRIIKDLDELKSWVGKEVAVSDWLLVDQARIQAFADVTEDQQWIHLDVERCRRESPYKAPIAHGYLILSLLPTLFERSLHIDGVAMAVNYGLDRVRLPAPVIAGSRIRGRLALERLDAVAGGRAGALGCHGRNRKRRKTSLRGADARPLLPLTQRKLKPESSHGSRIRSRRAGLPRRSSRLPARQAARRHPPARAPRRPQPVQARTFRAGRRSSTNRAGVRRPGRSNSAAPAGARRSSSSSKPNARWPMRRPSSPSA